VSALGWPNRWPKPLLLGPVEAAAGVRDQRVEGDTVVALAPVQELRVHVERHPARRARSVRRCRRGRRAGVRLHAPSRNSKSQRRAQRGAAACSFDRIASAVSRSTPRAGSPSNRKPDARSCSWRISGPARRVGRRPAFV
jgi:hypothetical protein